MPVRIDYSKSSSDISKESAARLKNDRRLFKDQKRVSLFLLRCKARKKCIVCNYMLKGEEFYHRDIVFISCKTCGHIQTRVQPPEDYPMNIMKGRDFKKIYPRLTSAQYTDRKQRIYKPKLDWAVACLNEIGYSSKKLRTLKWTEIGAGAGYFLSALEDFGVVDYKGFDSERSLVSFGQGFLRNDKILHFEGNIEESLEIFYADVFVAFFVFEHLNCSYNFFKELRKLKSGTILIFSVPTFGFSSLLENMFVNNWARSMNCEIHTQVFTDKSIDYAMQLCDFEIKAKWIFGQDVDDLIRYIDLSCREINDKKIYKQAMDKLLAVSNDLQGILDRNNLADQRHILAIKR